MTSSDRAAGLGHVLQGWPRRRVRLDELWRLFDTVDPGTRASLQRRQLLADVLAELAGTGHLALPGRHSFDRTEHPPLPRFVNLVRPEAPRQAVEPVLWYPALAWAANVPLTSAHRTALERINDWLFNADREVVVPMRERSLEILGNEKALDRLQLTDLFGPDRLSLDLLRARRVAPPFHTVRVSAGPILLVVENSDTFDSLKSVLNANPGRVGLIGWGAGAAFTASVLSLDVQAQGVRDIAYFGDLDANGLRIPSNADRLAQANGLPRVRPASGLYEALRFAGRGQAGQAEVDDATASTLVRWLNSEHRAWAAGLLRSGLRLAQEAVGLANLSRDSAWRKDLVGA